MYAFIFILQTVLAGIYGWFSASTEYELKIAKSYSESNKFHPWKVSLLWVIYMSLFFTQGYLGSTSVYKKSYDASKYEIVYGTDEMPTDSTTFKIIKK